MEVGVGGNLLDLKGSTLLTFEWDLGKATNNHAEHHAFYLGIEHIFSLGIQSIYWWLPLYYFSRQENSGSRG